LVAVAAVSCSDDSSGPSEPDDLSMDEVEEIVVNEIIPTETGQGASYICTRLIGTMPGGSTVEEDRPNGWPTPAGRSSHTSFTVDEESYFFFLDLAPYSFYEHDVKYIVVAKSGGSYDVIDARWWPKINGETPEQFLARVPDSSYVVEDTADLPAPIEEEMGFTIPDLGLIWKEGFLVIQGLMPDEKLYDEAVLNHQNVLSFFDAYKNSFSRLEGLADVQADNFAAVIDDMVSEGIDLITIYVLAHGSVDRIGLSGHGVSVTSFRNKMAEHPGVLFNFLLGSCHSGSFIDNLQTLENVRVVLTSCATDESAYPDWDVRDGLNDYNAMDSGTEWTSSILWAANVITNNSTHFSIVEDWAGTYGIPVTCEMLYQSHRGAVGLNNEMNLILNLDLTYRTEDATPKIYHSWRRR
jgi:hypothetical protein